MGGHVWSKLEGEFRRNETKRMSRKRRKELVGETIKSTKGRG